MKLRYYKTLSGGSLFIHLRVAMAHLANYTQIDHPMYLMELCGGKI